MAAVTLPWWFTEIDAQSRACLLEALDKNRFPLGEYARRLEEAIAGLVGHAHAVVTNSGTSALTMALLSYGVGPGDEVIVPAVTWIATAQAVQAVGARVVLADCRPDAPIIDPQEVRAKLTPRTRAIIPVHLNGRCCDIETLQGLADGAGAVLLEDTCKGFMSRTEKGYLGTLADGGCFSMGMISLLSVGYGGFILPKDEEHRERLLNIRDHGVRRSPEEYRYRGFNFKISDLLCALGLPQTQRMQEKIAHVVQVHRLYREGLAGNEHVRVLPVDIESGKVPLYTELFSERRADIVAHLRANGVEVSPYHLPLNRAAYLEAEGSFPNAERFTACSFMVPSGPSQPFENVEKTMDLLRSWAP